VTGKPRRRELAARYVERAAPQVEAGAVS
jgi:hypothetical protein